MIINNYRKSDKTFYESLLAGMEDTENYKTKKKGGGYFGFTNFLARKYGGILEFLAKLKIKRI